MIPRKSNWTEEDIQKLKGHEESLRLEFKAGALFKKPESSWIEDLSKEVSAFANTEGGTLVLGLPQEKIRKARVASDPDGVPADLFQRDWLQQKIEGSVSPYLPGILVHRVELASLPGRVVFVLDIPQGITAYQANDGRYYGRSELEAKYLRDHDVRFRMSRGKVAQSSLDFRLLRVTLGADVELELRKRHATALEAFANNAEAAVAKYPEAFLELMQGRFIPNIVEFALQLRNLGELTLRDPLVEFWESWSSDSFGNVSPDGKVSRREMASEVIYPGDARLVPDSNRQFRCKRDQPIKPNDYSCEWRVFLDNAPPSSGKLDLGNFLQNTLERAAGGVAAPPPAMTQAHNSAPG